jgi:hypothetical protein
MVEALSRPMTDGERAIFWHKKFLEKEKGEKDIIEDRNKEFRELMKKNAELNEANKYLLLCLRNASSPVPYDVNDAPLYYQYLRVSQAENLEKTQHIDALKKETDEWRAFWAYKKEALKAKDEELKAKDEALKAKDEALKAKDEALAVKDEALAVKDKAFCFFASRSAGQPSGGPPSANNKHKSSNIPAAFVEQRAPVPKVVPRTIPSNSAAYAKSAMASRPFAPGAAPY